MRTPGRHAKLPQEVIDWAVQEYLTTDRTGEDIATEIGIKSASLHYHIKKYRNQQQKEAKQP